MRTTLVLATGAALVGVGVGALWWRGRRPTTPSETTALERTRQDRSGEPMVAPDTRQRSGGKDAPPRVEGGGAVPRAGGRSAPVDPAAGPSLETVVLWPVARRSRAVRTAATIPPVVPTKLAFRALWYLGVDPEAEKTWTRAINDPSLPAGVRSDLIVDMIDEGYTDNNHPGPADLPVILARLEIIERHAPYAMDEVNARAFEQAYRILLEMYIRLGGKPRRRR